MCKDAIICRGRVCFQSAFRVTVTKKSHTLSDRAPMATARVRQHQSQRKLHGLLVQAAIARRVRCAEEAAAEDGGGGAAEDDAEGEGQGVGTVPAPPAKRARAQRRS